MFSNNDSSFEDDEVSSFDEYDDHMVEIPTNLYMEQINKYFTRMHGVESINEDPLMEENEVEFTFDE